jgi:hypothetical protein
MIDTFQIANAYARPPDFEFLESNGWEPLWNRKGEFTAFCFNSPRDELKPRLTVSQNPNNGWIVRAEVSPGGWLHNSNLYLPDENELSLVLDELSAYVEDKIGCRFDTRLGRVSRVDFTRDFQVGENALLPIIAKFGKVKLPRYRRVCFDETTVNFKNAGRKRTKEYLIYSKHHERSAKSEDECEREAAKGLLRFEVSFRKNGVNALVGELKLNSNQAKNVLTKETSERVIEKAMARLHFDSLLTAESPNIERLFESLGASAFSHIGFLYARDLYGDDLAKLPFIKVSAKTLKRYQDNCGKAGILSIE